MEYNQLDVLDIIASWVHDDKRVITPFLVANEFCIPIFEVQSYVFLAFIHHSLQLVFNMYLYVGSWKSLSNNQIKAAWQYCT